MGLANPQQFGKSKPTVKQNVYRNTAVAPTPALIKRAHVAEKTTEPNLHPSWVAKQKNKGIKEFSGKKINFSDDIAPSATNKKKPLPARSGESVVDQQLHPSWQAKQKLKPIISEFQGKKIKFGD